MSRDQGLSAPSGRQVRRWTRAASAQRTGGGVADLATDVYTALLAIALSTAVIASAATQLQGSAAAAGPSATGSGLSLDPRWLAVSVAVAAIVALAGLAARLGPVSLSAHQARWWLPLPVERRTLLRPATARWPVAAAVLTAPVGLALALALRSCPPAAVLAWCAVVAGATTAALVLATALTQPHKRAHRAAVATFDLALALLPVLALVLALFSTPPPAADGPLAVGAAVAVAVAAVLAVVVDRRAEYIHDGGLSQRGAVTGQAHEALLSLDTRALGRALSEGPRTSSRRTSSTLWWLRRLPRRWRPGAALVTSDALLLLRTPRHLVQLGSTACLTALALAVPSPHPGLVVAGYVVGAHLAGSAGAEGARRAQVGTTLDTLLPLSQHQVRRCRLVVPTAATVAWSVVVCAAVAWRYDGAGGWLAIGALSGPVWAAAAVRAAYRALPDLSGPLVHTPMGSFPSGAGTVASAGPDVAALGCVPLLIALLTGEVFAVLLLAQAVLSAGALALVARPAPPPGHRR